jgi:hypothetical protein
MVNRNDALHSDEWKDIPLDQQMGWLIPLEMMIDVPYLRSQDPSFSAPKFRHNVLLMSEFLVLQGLNETYIKPDGSWDREYYHSGVDFEYWGTHHEAALDLGVVRNDDYEPQGVVRVDTVFPMMGSSHRQPPKRSWANGLNYTGGSPNRPSGNPNHPSNSSNVHGDKEFGKPPKVEPVSFAQSCNTMLHDELNRKEDTSVLEWGFAIWVVDKAAREHNITVEGDEEIEAALNDAGWAVLHTWEGAYVFLSFIIVSWFNTVVLVVAWSL